MRPRFFASIAALFFFAAASAAQDPVEITDYTKVDPKSLDIEPCPKEKDEKTGFTIGGTNETALFAKLPTIAGRTIKQLEKDMRPGGLSRLGFLGPDESLLEILTADNRFVVETKGLTHQELGKHLHLVGAVAAKHGLEKPYQFLYHGKKFKATAKSFPNFVDSPFDDGTRANHAVVVWNVATGKTISFSLLVPHLVERYGFYEGKGTPYRVEPQAILDVFDFLAAKKDSGKP